MAKQQPTIVFDSRLVERSIRKGLITREQYDAYLAKLDDAAGNAEAIELELVRRAVVAGDDASLS